jgi:hypothetical protein
MLGVMGGLSLRTATACTIWFKVVCEKRGKRKKEKEKRRKKEGEKLRVVGFTVALPLMWQCLVWGHLLPATGVFRWTSPTTSRQSCISQPFQKAARLVELLEPEGKKINTHTHTHTRENTHTHQHKTHTHMYICMLTLQASNAEIVLSY